MMPPTFDMRVFNRLLELQAEADRCHLDRAIERLVQSKMNAKPAFAQNAGQNEGIGLA